MKTEEMNENDIWYALLEMEKSGEVVRVPCPEHLPGDEIPCHECLWWKTDETENRIKKLKEECIRE